MTRNENNELDAIKVDWKPPESIYTQEYSKTTMFLLPMLSININNIIFRRFFVDSFIDDKGADHEFIRPIFLLFQVGDLRDTDWVNLYKNCLKHTCYLTDYDLGVRDSKNLVMIVFTTPEKYKDDYYHFKSARYSKFSSEYKKVISKTILDKKGNLVPNLAYLVVNKDPAFKKKLEKDLNHKFDDEDEIWDIPRREREYFNYPVKTI